MFQLLKLEFITCTVQKQDCILHYLLYHYTMQKVMLFQCWICCIKKAVHTVHCHLPMHITCILKYWLSSILHKN